MTVRFTRTSHGAPRQSLGIEIDDDGHVLSWQTSGHRVGRFARELSASERPALERALAAARDADPPAASDPAAPVRPSGATEQLTADGLPDVVLKTPAPPPPGFGELIELLRTLREDLADDPVAAIELDVEDGAPLRARLRHVGSEAVAVRAGTVTVQATSYGRDSAVVDTATHTIDASGVDGPVEAGWELPLADDLGLAAAPRGGFRVVTVGTLEVDVLGDGVLRPAELSWMDE
jgi:hypothetical protein